MDILSKIKPLPQYAKQKDGRVILGTGGETAFEIVTENISGGLATKAVEVLQRTLCAQIGEKCGPTTVKITVRLSEDGPDTVAANPEQAYRIDAADGEIVLTGYGEAGVYYAVTTLMQCVCAEYNDVFVPQMEIVDWPDLKTRGHFVESRFGSNLMELADWKAVVDDIRDKKMNRLVISLYGCWTVQYDGMISEYVYIPVRKYPKIRSDVIKKYYSPTQGEWVSETVPTPMAEQDFFGALVQYGKECGVEVIPLWNSFGHNTLIPRAYPQVSARIGGKPSGFGFCLSCKETYDMLFSIYDQIIDEYLAPNGITSFHIGMDEVRLQIAADASDIFKKRSPWCECDACRKLSNEEKFINHAVKLIAYLKSRGMTSVYIYSDMFKKVASPEKFYEILKENDLLDVTVIDWWTYTNCKERLGFDTTYPALNIRSTVKPWNSYAHWSITFDTVPNVYHLCEIAQREKNIEGLLSYCGWDQSCDKNHASMADYSWNFDGTGSVDDFRATYAMREFPGHFEEAKRALELVDQISEEQSSSGEEGRVGNMTFLQNDVCYYFFCNVAEGKEYPRNFPGEGMGRILEKREMYEKQLADIADMASQALEVFDQLSVAQDCNRALAKRFACETQNYLCLAKDYLALLEIYDTVTAGAANASQCVAQIAGKRKQERLALMDKIENVKEVYLIPCQLRNQSIFMQLFADIEAFAAKTGAGTPAIDVCNLKNLATDKFWWLR